MKREIKKKQKKGINAICQDNPVSCVGSVSNIMEQSIFCSTKQCFMHIDFFNMLVIQGPSLESVESGYPQENTVKMTGYRNKYEMMDGIAKEANQDRKEELARTRPEEYKMDTNGKVFKL